MEWFRDLVIIIFGLVATIAIVIQTLLRLQMYKRTKDILESVKTTTRTVEEITQTVDAELSGPLGQIVAVLRGVREGLGFFSSFGRKKRR